MAQLFSQNSANWNSANMWNTAANGSGSYVTPGATDVCIANNKTVTVNISVTVAEVRNDTTGGATGGGYFSLNNSVTLTANIYTGNVASSGGACVYYSGNTPNSATIIGNSFGGIVASNSGIYNASTGTLNVSGNITGGTGSYGLANLSTGIVNVTGNVTGGSTSYGATNSAGGTLIVNGTAIGNDYGFGSVGLSATPGVYGSQTGTTKVRSIQIGSRGQWPTAGNVFVDPTITSKITVTKSDFTTENYFTTESADWPAVTNVRYGTGYNYNGLTGTCRIPDPANVLLGVPTDATTGSHPPISVSDSWNYNSRSLTRTPKNTKK